MLCYPMRFPHKNDFQFVFIPICFVGVHVLFITSGTGTAILSGAPEFTPGFSGVHVTKFLVSYAVFRRLLFVLFSFFF